jgi:hypothetical protein
VEGSCEHGNEPSGSIKCLEFPEYLSDWRLLKDSAPYSYRVGVGDRSISEVRTAFTVILLFTCG